MCLLVHSHLTLFPSLALFIIINLSAPPLPRPLPLPLSLSTQSASDLRKLLSTKKPFRPNQPPTAFFAPELLGVPPPPPLSPLPLTYFASP